MSVLLVNRDCDYQLIRANFGCIFVMWSFIGFCHLCIQLAAHLMQIFNECMFVSQHWSIQLLVIRMFNEK